MVVAHAVIYCLESVYHVHVFVIKLQQSVECEVYDDDEDLQHPWLWPTVGGCRLDAFIW